MNLYFKEILYNGHLQSLGAAGLVYLSAIFLGADVPIILYLITYSLFQLIYRFDAYYSRRRDELTNKSRVEFLNTHKTWVYSSFSFFLFFLVALLFYTNAGMVLVSLTILVAGILYPVMFKDISKYIPLFKNLYVSSVFAFLTIYPFVILDISVRASLELKLLALFIFLESLLMQGILDLKDLETDKRDGLLTLPTMVGFHRAVFLLTAGSFLVFVSFSFTSLFLLSVPALVLNLWALYLVGHGKQSGYTVAAFKFIVWASLFLWAQFI